MNLGKIVDRVGDTNPQLFRELKERLTLRNLGIAIVASLLVQVLTFLYFSGQIPVAVPDVVSIERSNSIDRPTAERRFKVNENTYSKYCSFSSNDGYTALCQLDGNGNFKVNWQIWRSDIFNSLSWILSFGLILGAVYTLVADLVREEKRGTLNFIRLSPQSAPTIFIGKVLGIPILVYLAAALMLPLHLGFGLSLSASPALLVSWYLTICATWWLFASTAVLYVLLGGVQAIVTTIAMAFPLGVPLLVTNAYLGGTINHESWLGKSSDRISWFGLPITSSAVWIYIFSTCSFAIASYWVWQALERRYLNPTATAIGKRQSYFINLCLQLWVGGFTLPLIFAQPANYLTTRQLISGLAIGDFMALLLSIFMLLPSKQALQDWSRHRREHTNRGRKFWQRDLVRDLISNDKSPALLTIAINIGMAMAVWLPAAVFGLTKVSNSMSFNGWSAPGYGLKLATGVCLAATLILIYATIAHLGLFLKVKKQHVWIVGIVGIVAISPLGIAYVLSMARVPSDLLEIVVLFSPFAPMTLFQVSTGAILATLVAQIAVFATLARQLQRKLQISGRSQSQELLARS
ncbi:hypothetical protein [Chamaesiphon sp. OTE_75_metabat_556]|uniref:hypothetical protein n=1 Tax=Chamaesiphon sp. OTE_75_metabat_556 TaxID=2964692 RepID=UPI00286ADA49|nr:hypothetical protein [Chamaesiphon sp. OTE_75_metabat_556]